MIIFRLVIFCSFICYSHSQNTCDVYKGPNICGQPVNVFGYNSDVYVLTLNDATKYQCLFKVKDTQNIQQSFNEADNMLTINDLGNTSMIKNNIDIIRKVEATEKYIALLTVTGKLYVKMIDDPANKFNLLVTEESVDSTIPNDDKEYSLSFINDFSIVGDQIAYVKGRGKICVIDYFTIVADNSRYLAYQECIHIKNDVTPQARLETNNSFKHNNGNHIIGDIFAVNNYIFVMIYDNINILPTKHQRIYAFEILVSGKSKLLSTLRSSFLTAGTSIADKMLPSEVNFHNEKFYTYNDMNDINSVQGYKLYTQQSNNQIICYKDTINKITYDSTNLSIGINNTIIDMYASDSILIVVHHEAVFILKTKETCDNVDLSIGTVSKITDKTNIISSFVSPSLKNHIIDINNTNVTLYTLEEQSTKLVSLCKKVNL